MDASQQTQLLKGLADLGVLSALRDGPEYGLSLVDRLRSEAGLEVAEGSIYPILHRMVKAGSIEAEWVLQEGNVRPRKYYRLTEAGRAELAASTHTWLRISESLNHFLKRSPSNEPK